MVIFCSDLPNDQDMIKALGSCALPCPIPSGDACFWGVGDNDSTLKVSIERKKIGDICQCINDGRYLYQAQSSKDDGIDVLCLIVEGRIHRNLDDGLLEVPVWRVNPKTGKRAEFYAPVRPAITYSRFDQFLTELDFLAGIIVKRSENVRETTDIIKSLYDNFQTPPSKHNSLRQIYSQPNRDAVSLTRPGLVRRIAKEFSGVGLQRSRAVADRFKTVKEMVNADVKQWLEVDGIGKKTAEKVIKEINGGI